MLPCVCPLALRVLRNALHLGKRPDARIGEHRSAIRLAFWTMWVGWHRDRPGT